MPKTTVIQTFTKGMNGDASPFVLDLSQAAQLQNMFLERGILISRPGIKQIYSSIPNINFPYWLEIPYLNPAAYSSASGNMFHTTAAGGALKMRTLSVASDQFLLESADVAGPGITASSGPYGLSHTSFNGVSLIGGLAQGILRFTGVGAYTLPHNVPYRFLAVHNSRVLAANNAAGYANQFAWSKIGDETVWTGTYDSGTQLMQEADDGITGLAVIRDVVVAARPYGFHLGVTTGNATNPYNWKCFSKEHHGCVYAMTFAKYGDKCFFVSDTDIHTFDLSTIADIGEGISTELFGYLKQYNCDLVGFITRSYKPGRRPMYHLMPTFMPNDAAHPGVDKIPINLPHFIYDILEGVWSRVDYNTPMAGVADDWPMFGFNLPVINYNTDLARTNPVNTVGLLRRAYGVGIGSIYWYWDYAGFATQIACDSVQSFTTGRMQLVNPEKDTSLLRVYLVANLTLAPAGTPITLSILSEQGNAHTTVSPTIHPTVTLNPGWVRLRWDKIQVGQFFQLVFTIAAGCKVQVRQVVVEFEQQEQDSRV